MSSNELKRVVVQLAYVTWRENFFQKVRDRLLQALLQEVERERNSEQIDRALVKAVILSFGTWREARVLVS